MLLSRLPSRTDEIHLQRRKSNSVYTMGDHSFRTGGGGVAGHLNFFGQNNFFRNYYFLDASDPLKKKKCLTLTRAKQVFKVTEPAFNLSIDFINSLSTQPHCRVDFSLIRVSRSAVEGLIEFVHEAGTRLAHPHSWQKILCSHQNLYSHPHPLQKKSKKSR